MKIELIPNLIKDPELKCTGMFIDELNKYDCELYVSVEDKAFSGLEGKNVTLGETGSPDVMLVLGGDGSIIRTAHKAAKNNIPLLGVNLGRVGYLAELEPDDVGCISNLFSGNYFYEERMMLDVWLKNGRSNAIMHALNDAVLSRGPQCSIAEFSLSCNGNSVGTYRADGIIVATPTGSTAYAMSAGGPVLDPSLQCISTVPVCPQTFGARTIVFSPDSEIELKNLCEHENQLFLGVDGEDNIPLSPGDVVAVKKSEMKLRMIRMKRSQKNEFSPFFHILNQKMSEYRQDI